MGLYKFVYAFGHFSFFFSYLIFTFLRFLPRKFGTTCSEISGKGEIILVCESDAACFQ